MVDDRIFSILNPLSSNNYLLFSIVYRPALYCLHRGIQKEVFQKNKGSVLNPYLHCNQCRQIQGLAKHAET